MNSSSANFTGSLQATAEEDQVYLCEDTVCIVFGFTPIAMAFLFVPVFNAQIIVQGYQAQKFVKETRSSWLPLEGKVVKKSSTEPSYDEPVRYYIVIECEVEGETLQRTFNLGGDETKYQTAEVGQPSEALLYFPGYPLSAELKESIDRIMKGRASWKIITDLVVVACLFTLPLWCLFNAVPPLQGIFIITITPLAIPSIVSCIYGRNLQWAKHGRYTMLHKAGWSKMARTNQVAPYGLGEHSELPII